ncbi:hypothetical protein [Bacteroides caccae]|uniref:Uncharacterized protein n=1 Tax=Bacteroides caccae TaxID=47678 RepID=A0AAW7WPK8_9BACE|nr:MULTISPECIES: hypothetical protein [Bacteroides]MDO6328352.1 hypothetical protein [Bacteroides caccae]MDO6339411.1 hypothetical protein [Bacteroides caccae]MDO6358247.1 hypothetical protein [Bacteroides caccae]
MAVNAQPQRLKLVDTPEADEVYIREWALNTAAVTRAGRNVFYVWKQEE